MVENWYKCNSLSVWENSPVNPFGSSAFHFGRLLVNDSIFKIDTGLFILSIFSCVYFANVSFQRMDPFNLGY